MSPTCYATDHPISQAVCKAFAKGCNGSLSPPDHLLDGDVFTYGILRGCGELIRKCEMARRDYLHCDLGYFRRSNHGRGDFSGYYRVTKNGFQRDWDENEKEFPSDRWDKLRISLRPWKKTGKNVILVPPSMNWGQFEGIFPPKWVENVTSVVRNHTDRPILVSNKHSEPLSKQIEDAWCVIVHNSNAAIEALIEGVPVFTTGESAAWIMGLDDLSKIENPLRDVDRERYFRALAYEQFTLAEFLSGEAWATIQKS